VVPPADALAHWHEFYTLLGTTAGTLVGLLFVAASLASGVLSSDRSAPVRMFWSATLVQFGSILLAALLLLAPIGNWIVLGMMVVAVGLLGIAYYVFAVLDAKRDGLLASIDFEDRVWYALLPVVTYLFEAISGIMLAARWAAGCMVLALSLTALLVVAIHNAWDITVWAITRRRD